MSITDLADEEAPDGLPRFPAPRTELALRTFTFYIDDDRYSVPTLNVLAMADDGMARAWAEGAMRENPHYLGVEVCEDGERLFGVGRKADEPHTESLR